MALETRKKELDGFIVLYNYCVYFEAQSGFLQSDYFTFRGCFVLLFIISIVLLEILKSPALKLPYSAKSRNLLPNTSSWLWTTFQPDLSSLLSLLNSWFFFVQKAIREAGRTSFFAWIWLICGLDQHVGFGLIIQLLCLSQVVWWEYKCIRNIWTWYELNTTTTVSNIFFLDICYCFGSGGLTQETASCETSGKRFQPIKHSIQTLNPGLRYSSIWVCSAK